MDDDVAAISQGLSVSERSLVPVIDGQPFLIQFVPDFMHHTVEVSDAVHRSDDEAVCPVAFGIHVEDLYILAFAVFSCIIVCSFALLSRLRRAMHACMTPTCSNRTYLKNRRRELRGNWKLWRYSAIEKGRAVAYYLEHGCNLARTTKKPRYPSEAYLAMWADELRPGSRRIRKAHAPLSQGQQKEAVIALCMREDDAQSVADRHGVSMEHFSFFNWFSTNSLQIGIYC